MTMPLNGLNELDCLRIIAGNILAGGGGSPSSLTVTQQAGASYTLAATDAGTIVEMTSGSASTVVIPTNASVPIAIGKYFYVRQGGAGVTAIDGSAVTFHNPTGVNTIASQYSVVVLQKTATDTWAASGAFGPLSITVTGLTVTNTGTQINFGYDAGHRGTIIMDSGGSTVLLTPGQMTFNAGGGNALALGNNYLQIQGSNGSIITQSTTTADGVANICVYNDGGGQFGGGTGIGPCGAAHRSGFVANGTTVFFCDPTLAVLLAPLRLKSYTVATLPAAATAGAGAKAFATDLLTPVALATAVGGGAVGYDVVSDGTNWKVG